MIIYQIGFMPYHEQQCQNLENYNPYYFKSVEKRRTIKVHAKHESQLMRLAAIQCS